MSPDKKRIAEGEISWMTRPPTASPSFSVRISFVSIIRIFAERRLGLGCQAVRTTAMSGRPRWSCSSTSAAASDFAWVATGAAGRERAGALGDGSAVDSELGSSRRGLAARVSFRRAAATDSLFALVGGFGAETATSLWVARRSVGVGEGRAGERVVRMGVGARGGARVGLGIGVGLGVGVRIELALRSGRGEAGLAAAVLDARTAGVGVTAARGISSSAAGATG